IRALTALARVVFWSADSLGGLLWQSVLRVESVFFLTQFLSTCSKPTSSPPMVNVTTVVEVDRALICAGSFIVLSWFGLEMSAVTAPLHATKPVPRFSPSKGPYAKSERSHLLVSL